MYENVRTLAHIAVNSKVNNGGYIFRRVKGGKIDSWNWVGTKNGIYNKYIPAPIDMYRKLRFYTFWVCNVQVQLLLFHRRIICLPESKIFQIQAI